METTETPAGVIGPADPRSALPALQEEVDEALLPVRTGGSFTCNGCGGRFADGETCHCRLCHRTFSSVTGFDAHQPNPRGCLDLLKQRHAPGTKHEGLPKWAVSARTVGGKGYRPFTFNVISSVRYGTFGPKEGE